MVEINLIIGFVVLVVFILFLKSVNNNLSNDTISRTAVKQEAIIDTQTPDHGYIPCDVCNKPAIGRFTKNKRYTYGSLHLSPRHYCSIECKKHDQYPKKYLLTSLAVVVFVPPLLSSNELSKLVTVLGLIILVVALIDILIFSISKKGFKSDPRRFYGKLYKGQADQVIEQDQENSMVYSELLNTKVRQCCYQSARLNDKYCICGRAVKYPVS